MRTTCINVQPGLSVPKTLHGTMLWRRELGERQSVPSRGKAASCFPQPLLVIFQRLFWACPAWKAPSQTTSRDHHDPTDSLMTSPLIERGTFGNIKHRKCRTHLNIIAQEVNPRRQDNLKEIVYICVCQPTTHRLRPWTNITAQDPKVVIPFLSLNYFLLPQILFYSFSLISQFIPEIQE